MQASLKLKLAKFIFEIAGSLGWLRVLGKLSSRTDSCRVQLSQIPPFTYCCFCSISCQMDAWSIWLSMGQYNFLYLCVSVLIAKQISLLTCCLTVHYLLQNPTLEHYTCYKAAELRVTVTAMQDLQLNTINCTLNAIREKYRHEKVIRMTKSFD